MLTISSVAVSPMPVQGPVLARTQPVTPTRPSETVSPENRGVGTPVSVSGEAGRAQVVYAPPALPPVDPTGELLRAENFNNTAAPERFNAQALAAQAGFAASVAAQRHALEGQAPDLAGPQQQQGAQTGQGLAQAPQAQAQAQAGQQPGQLTPSLQRMEQERLERTQLERQRQNLEGQLPPPPPNPVDEARANQIRDLLPNVWSASRFAADQLIGEEAREAAQRRAELLAPDPPGPTDRALEAAAENYQRTSSLPLPPSAGINVDRLI